MTEPGKGIEGYGEEGGAGRDGPSRRRPSSSRFPRLSRRQILKAGLGGVALLVLGGGVAALRPPSVAGGTPLGFLGTEDQKVMRAVARAILNETTAAADPGLLQQVVVDMDKAIRRLPPAVQGEIRELLGLMEFAPTRIFLFGLWSGWDSASTQAVDGALTGLRNSDFQLKRSIYLALHDMTLAAWYGNPRSWASIGYPGPPVIERD